MSGVPYSRFVFGTLPWYSVLIVSGAIAAIVLASREEVRAGLEKDTVIDLALWLLPCGIIGARLYYVAFSWNQFRGDLLSVLRVWEGGIAIYGGVIAGLLTILVFSRIRGIPPLRLCDVIAPGLVLAQAIGRWGNFFNMEAYGIEIMNPALQFFPFGVRISGETGWVWHMAAFFYESCWNLLVFIVLMIGRRKWFRKEGDVFFFYAFLYACGRLIIEDFRTDSLYAGSSVRVSQLLSVLICATFLIRCRLHSGARKTRPPAAGWFLFFPALAFVLVTAGYCLNIGLHPAGMSVSVRALLLCSFSALCILTAALMYGRSDEGEIRYAVHPD